MYAIPPAEMTGVTEIAGLAAGKAFGPKAESVISILISFALISSLSAFIILGPRVYYSMTKEGYFFAFAAKSSSQVQSAGWRYFTAKFDCDCTCFVWDF
ncbi:MAG: amino acid permease [Draconibacterium sp.]|nr:amino acid permease [Draconibacterium sp.]